MVDQSGTDRHLFLNRELSWLAFNERVLSEARNGSLPMHERIKFLSIVSSNLDEFFMVRVAGIKQQAQGVVADLPADGMLPGEQLAAISERTHKMSDEQYRVWKGELLPLLAAHGLTVLSRDALTAEQKAAAKIWFQSNVFPALTPLAGISWQVKDGALILTSEQGFSGKPGSSGEPLPLEDPEALEALRHVLRRLGTSPDGNTADSDFEI